MDIREIKWLDAATHRTPAWPLCGYAPGNYMSRCLICNLQFMHMDKRAIHCLPCAIEAAQKGLEKSRAELKQVRAENETLRAAIQIVSPRTETALEQPTADATEVNETGA